MDVFDFINCPVTNHHVEEYQAGKPFPHIVIDDFLKGEVLESLHLPPLDSRFYSYDNAFEKKKATDRPSVMGSSVSAFMFFLNSGLFTEWLERLTGVEGIIGDPSFRGGGLHYIQPGGYLRAHKDFNYHAKLGLYRRINVIIYLNQRWQKSWGGGLELWSSDMKILNHVIEPVYNRAVIFDTAGDHYHGHSEPLKCPEDRMRQSIAWYGYTAKPAEGQSHLAPHSTKFQLRPGDPRTPEILELMEKRNNGRLASNV